MVVGDGKNDAVELENEVMVFDGVCNAGLVEDFDGRIDLMELDDGLTLTDLSTNVLEIDEDDLVTEGKIGVTLNGDFDGTFVGIELDEGLFL